MKLLSFLKDKVSKKDVQAIGIEKEVKTLQLESLLELQKALDNSSWAEDGFKSKFIDSMNKNILENKKEIAALNSKLTRAERKELQTWHGLIKSFVVKSL